MKPFEELKEIYDKVFSNLNGYSVSLNEKNQKQNQKYFKDVIYGESPFELMYALFCMEPMASYLQKATNFYDLGSGIGNTVISAYLIKDFKKCVGVELLESLYNISTQAKNKLININKQAQDKIDFINKNILDVNLHEAESILFCCPNTDVQILAEMEEKFKKELKIGCFIMSIIYPFQDKNKFQFLETRNIRTAWGTAPLNLYLVK